MRSWSDPILMRVDNQSAMNFAHNGGTNCGNNHIDIRYHYTRPVIEKRVLKLEYFPTDEVLADMFPKSLGRVKLETFSACVGLKLSKYASQS